MEARVDSSARPQGPAGAVFGSGGASHAASSEALAGVVPAHLLDEGEIVILAIKPSLWYVLFDAARVLTALIVIILVTRYILAEELRPAWSRVTYQLCAAAVLAQLTVSFFRWLSRLYVLTNRRIIRIRGVFNVDVFEASLARIQNTYLTLAIHERLVGLGSIQFLTAGTAGIEATWQNINRPLEVHEEIRRAIRRMQHPGQNGGL